jgi:hypothetical protein
MVLEARELESMVQHMNLGVHTCSFGEHTQTTA